jgi:hypothetical protein
MAPKKRIHRGMLEIVSEEQAFAIPALSANELEAKGEKKIDANDVMAEGGKEAFEKALEESDTVRLHSAIPDMFTFNRLRHEYPTLNDPVIEGILREGEVMNIVAAPKVGKSMLGANIAMCVISGGKLFEQFQCAKGRVLIVDNELHKNLLAHRLTQVADAYGLNLNYAGRMVDILSLRGSLKDVKSISQYFEKIAEKRYKIILLDAWYKLLPTGTNENSNADIAGLYSVLDSYAEKVGSSLIVVHHFAKGLHGEKNATDLGAGAGAQSRAADTHLGILEHSEGGVAVIKAAVRSFRAPEPFCARFKYPKWEAAPGFSPDDARTTQDGTARKAGGTDSRKEAQEAAWSATLASMTTPMDLTEIMALAQIKGVERTGRDKTLTRIKVWTMQGQAQEIAPDGPRTQTKYVAVQGNTAIIDGESPQQFDHAMIADAMAHAADEADGYTDS